MPDNKRSSSILSQTDLRPGVLEDKIAIVTGAGGGIGYEAAASLLWLGATVIIAEIDRKSGKKAAKALTHDFPEDRIAFFPVDVSSPTSVKTFFTRVNKRYQHIDILIHNATIAPLGLVKDTPIKIWDASYGVNLRGPVILTRIFLPSMLERNAGVIVFVSSTGTAYMGAYETFKAAQVHLANTLDAELENTGINVFTIGPGLVPTKTATRAISELAPKIGMDEDTFYEINKGAMLTVEEAGAGFAAAVVLADQFRGQEISSLQALNAAGYEVQSVESPDDQINLTPQERAEALTLAQKVLDTFKDQSNDWANRSLFERQWMLRDFKKHAGMPVDAWRNQLENLNEQLANDLEVVKIPLQKLSSYYDHLAELYRGFEKDKDKLAENLNHIQHWAAEVNALDQILFK